MKRWLNLLLCTFLIGSSSYAQTQFLIDSVQTTQFYGSFGVPVQVPVKLKAIDSLSQQQVFYAGDIIFYYQTDSMVSLGIPPTSDTTLIIPHDTIFVDTQGTQFIIPITPTASKFRIGGNVIIVWPTRYDSLGPNIAPLGDSLIIHITIGPNSLPSMSDNRNVKLFPNPATHQLYISFLQQETGKQYEIYDINGRIIHQGILGEGQSFVNVEHLSAGMYGLHLFTSKGNRYYLPFIRQ